MLCEALLHVLVEKGVISRQEALEAINGVAELARELDERRTRPAKTPPVGPAAMTLVQTIAESFAAKEQIRGNGVMKRNRNRRRVRADQESG